MLRCHQCGYRDAPPELCPNCQSSQLGPMRGAGTEWLVSEVKKHVGELPIYHYDADHRDDLSLNLLDGEPGLVVATTALLRHPRLYLTSHSSQLRLLDTLLTVSDFRAEEETLRLLLQLAELQPAGRPLTLLQTFQGEHPILETLSSPKTTGTAIHTYLQKVLERRRAYRYPPLRFALAKIQVSAKDSATAEQEAKWLANALNVRATAKRRGARTESLPRLRGCAECTPTNCSSAPRLGVGFSTCLSPSAPTADVPASGSTWTQARHRRVLRLEEVFRG